MHSKITMPFLFLFFFAALLLSCGDSGPNTAKAPIVQARQQIKEQRTSPLTYVRGKVSDATVSVQYGAPSVKGRRIWGDLVPYGEVWRMGANEATWIELDKGLRLAGKVLPAGKYGLLCIPGPSVWTLILNREWDQWGAYYYSESADVVRIEIPVMAEEVFSEVMYFGVEGGQLRFGWAGLAWAVPMEPV